MKIAVCSKGQNMTDTLSLALWQTPYIIIFDTETQETKVIQNFCKHHGRRCCCPEKTVRHIILNRTNTFIGTLSNLSDVRRLKHHGIAFIEMKPDLTVAQALDKYQRTALHTLD